MTLAAFDVVCLDASILSYQTPFLFNTTNNPLREQQMNFDELFQFMQVSLPIVHGGFWIVPPAYLFLSLLHAEYSD